MKSIIVFGACSAIAQATERLWTQEKAQFVLVDRDEKKLAIVADDLKARGAHSVWIIAADLTELSSHASLWQKVVRYIGHIDTVLFSYGTLGDQKAGEQDFSLAYQEFMTNFISVASLLTEIVNHVLNIHYRTASMSRQGGTSLSRASRHAPPQGGAVAAARLPITLAVISSVAGDRGRQSNYIYGAAKGGLTVFLQGLRNRLAPKGIHVLTIKPGFVDTPMTKDFKKGFLWVKPEAVARSIVKAVNKKRDVVYAPWFWRYIMLIIRLIPERIFKKMTL